jgi:hypothetical protein
MDDEHLMPNVKDVDVQIVPYGRKKTYGIVTVKDVDVLILHYGRKKTYGIVSVKDVDVPILQYGKKKMHNIMLQGQMQLLIWHASM